MAIDPDMLSQALRTRPDQDVTETPIVRAIILADPANAAELVPYLAEGTLAGQNARRILCHLGPSAVPYLAHALTTAGSRARKEGLEVLWTLLVNESDWTIRKALGSAKPDLDVLFTDSSPLPDEMPPYVERDFRGRICDLAFMVIQHLLNPRSQSDFPMLADSDRDKAINRLREYGYGAGTS